MSLPANPSKSFIARNPELYGEVPCLIGDSPLGSQAETRPTAKRRLRQSSKPLLNDLEEAWAVHLTPVVVSSGCRFFAQSITFRLASGVRYTPDFFSFDWPALGEVNRPTAWEVKGPQQIQDDAAVKLKVFAAQYPQVRTILVWKEKGSLVWQTQRILP